MNVNDIVQLLNWYQQLERDVGEDGARNIINTRFYERPEPVQPLVSIAPPEPIPLPPMPVDTEQLAAKHELSVREKQIMLYLRDGLSNKSIARRCDCTEGTIKVHMKTILRKIGRANRTQAAIWAINNLSN